MRYIIITLAAILLFALTGCSAQTGNEIHIICEAVETDLISQRLCNNVTLTVCVLKKRRAA